jgi:hypothetical protein
MTVDQLSCGDVRVRVLAQVKGRHCEVDPVVRAGSLHAFVYLRELRSMVYKYSDRHTPNTIGEGDHAVVYGVRPARESRLPESIEH